MKNHCPRFRCHWRGAIRQIAAGGKADKRRGTRRKIYIATAQAWDDEMRDRIARHRADRGDGWQTVEAPQDLCGALARLIRRRVVLVDCATMWLTNRMLAGGDLEAETAGAVWPPLPPARPRWWWSSNEVGWSIVPDNALARQFRDAQGRLNQRLAAQAGLVVAVMAGLPLVLKGELPAGLA